MRHQQPIIGPHRSARVKSKMKASPRRLSRRCKVSCAIAAAYCVSVGRCSHRLAVVRAQDQDPNNFFCGTSWADASETCEERQHCPTGSNDECILEEQSCFGGTTCSAALGHGAIFKYTKLLNPDDMDYDDPANTHFCGPAWSAAIEGCSIETHCPSGAWDACPSGLMCFENLPCNVVDIVKEFVATLNIDANVDITTEEGGGEEGSSEILIEQEGIDTTIEIATPTNSPVLPSIENFPAIISSPTPSFAGNGPGSETMPPVGDDGQGDPVEEWVENTNAPSPSYVDTTEGEWSQITTPIPTYTNNTYESNASSEIDNGGEEWVENDEDATSPINANNTDNSNSASDIDNGGEDWGQDNAPSGEDDGMNLWCGESEFDATRNCGTGTACPDGICPGDLNCFMVSSLCGDGTGSETGDTNNEVEGAVSEDPPTQSPETSPSAGSAGDVTDTFFCGKDRVDASAYCFKRCRSGSPGECPSGMTCFGYTTCTTETGETSTSESVPPTPSPIEISSTAARNLCAFNYPELVENCWTAVECSSTTPCPDSGQTCFENVNCDLTAPKKPSSLAPSPAMTITTNNDGIRQNYCARSKAELDTSCFTAITCNAGEICPSGSYCFGDFPCGMTKLTPSPVASTPSPVISTESPVTLLPTSNTNAESNLSEPSLPQLLCASNMDELKASCATADDCSSGPCPAGMFCFPFECQDVAQGEPAETIDNTAQPDEETIVEEDQQNNIDNNDEQQNNNNNNNNDLCPEGYVGWHARRDCTEYYECNNGPAGPLFVCEEGLKFDQIRSECFDMSLVNPLCYGPALGQPQPIFCPSGYTGWHSGGDCKEYFECDKGSPGVTHVCGTSYKFDKFRNVCNDELLVDSFCYGPALTKAEQQKLSGALPGGNKETTDTLCLERYTGWETQPGCREYYWCDDGKADIMHSCGEDLLFDREIQLCNFADEVQCDVSSDNDNPSPSPPNTPSQRVTLFPTFGSRPETEEKLWSKTASPTIIPESQRESPPWLSHTIKKNSGGGNKSMKTNALILACAFLVLL